MKKHLSATCAALALPLLTLLFAAAASAQTARDKGIEFFRAGEYKSAVKMLKTVVKIDKTDGEAWYFLAAAQLGEGKPKDAESSFRSALKSNERDARAKTGLAYALLLRNKNREAAIEARSALEINKNNAEAHYIIGVTNFRDEIFSSAYENAQKAIKVNPNFADAYVLKTESLVNSFAKQNGTILKPANPRAELLKEAADSLASYMKIANPKQVSDYYKNYFESLKFFAEYYKNRDAAAPVDQNSVAAVNPGETEFKILEKAKPAYSEKARDAGIQGTIRLLVGFSEDGTVKHILAIRSLGFGLDENAVAAARKIKFVPPAKNGKPYSVVKTLEYSFSMY